MSVESAFMIVCSFTRAFGYTYTMCATVPALCARNTHDVSLLEPTNSHQFIAYEVSRAIVSPAYGLIAIHPASNPLALFFTSVTLSGSFTVNPCV